MNISQIVQSLDVFCQSTKDYYYVYDFKNHSFYFSKNIKQSRTLLSTLEQKTTIEKCLSIIDSRDIEQFKKTMIDVKDQSRQSYNFNFRFIQSEQQTLWFNNKGKIFKDDQGNLDYVLGRLSHYDIDNHSTNINVKKLKEILHQYVIQNDAGYLLIVGIDDMKTINMKKGRSFGDGIISEVAYHIERLTSNQYPVFRINGDCFAIVLKDYQDHQVSQLFTDLQLILEPQCTLSAGTVSLNEYHTVNEDILIQYAECALDNAKAKGKKCLQFFEPKHYEKKIFELELIENIIRNIQDQFKGFELYYQPQFDSSDFQLYGAEALVRFVNDSGERLSPGQFVNVLEQNDLMYQVGMWIFKTALKACYEWRQIYPDFHISINMSFSQLEHESIEYDVLEAIKQSGVPGEAVTIEITESMQLSNYHYLNKLFSAWKDYGIKLSIDDFGTGYSSLQYLKDMAVDEIKIDRCFVREIQNSLYNYRLVNNIMELADTSHIQVCCEGVETYEELKVLKDLHPKLLQGFLFSQPCSKKDFENTFMSVQNGLNIEKINHILSKMQSVDYMKPNQKNEIADMILNAENDIFYLSDLETYELYYLNSAGQNLFHMHDYYGKKCYEVLHGLRKPCPFCTNQYLKQGHFYVWEKQNDHCQRHFLLKDTIVLFQGKKVRMEVAIDITQQEHVSQNTQEQLRFAKKIVGYMDTLSQCTNFNEAVEQVLASVGDFYRADRAYLFQPDLLERDHWNNTFEWCATNVEPQIHNLQKVPPKVLERWMKIFDRNESIILYNLAPLRKTSFHEWKVLHSQGIQRLIVVPMRDHGHTIGFVGVDNPRYSIHDDSQIRVLASSLLSRMRHDRISKRYYQLLQESNKDILMAFKVGFWSLQLDKNNQNNLLSLDQTLKQILDSPEDYNDAQNYQYWISRMEKTTDDSIYKAFREMQQTGNVQKVEYMWQHHDKGPIKLRLSGFLFEENENYVKFRGFCRVIDE